MERISEDGNIHDTKRLKELQSLPLDRKIGITQARIMEFYREFDGQVYVAFSGGKDSTVLLDICRKLFPEIEAVFVDTGLEYPEIREFVKTYENVTWLKPEMNFRKVIETYGYPVIGKEVAYSIECSRRANLKKKSKHFSIYNGEELWGYESQRFNPNSQHSIKYKKRFCLEKWNNLRISDIKISSKCCDIMKKNPAKKYQDKTNKKQIVGTLAVESDRRKSEWLRYGCNLIHANRPASKPLSFWTEQDILKYIKFNNLKISEAYGEIIEENGRLKTTKCDRTGCMFCMFGCHLEKEPNRFQKLKETHPKIYEYCMRDWEGGGLGLAKVLDFIGVKYQ